MMKVILAVLFAIVAFMAPTEAAYCRHSAYKLPCKVVVAAKAALFKQCGFTILKKNKSKLAANEVFILGYKQFSSGCCQYRQRVLNTNAWNNKYKGCEEASKFYLNPNGAQQSLKGAKGACATLSFSGNCK